MGIKITIKEIKPKAEVRSAIEYLTKWYDQQKFREPLLEKFEARTEIDGKKYEIIIRKR